MDDNTGMIVIVLVFPVFLEGIYLHATETIIFCDINTEVISLIQLTLAYSISLRLSVTTHMSKLKYTQVC